MAFEEALTTAGLTDITDALNAGQEVEISEIHLGAGRTSPTILDAALETPFVPEKAFDIEAVQQLSDDKLAFLFEDRTNNAYTYSELGVFTSAGVMVYHAVETDSTIHLGQKQANQGQVYAYTTSLSSALMAALSFPIAAALPASESRAGLVTFASAAEARIQTEANQAVNRAVSVRRLWQAITSRLATAAQAIAGVNATKLMTPFLTKQAIDAQRPNIIISTTDPVADQWADGDIWFKREP